jgi:uncharacterized protein (UPF0332 family)
MISLFDKEAIHTGKLAMEYSRMLHRLFEARLESDYKEFVQHTEEEARSLLAMAKRFVAAIKDPWGNHPSHFPCRVSPSLPTCLPNPLPIKLPE